MPFARSQAPRFSLVAADDPVANTIQFFDGYFPSLVAGNYTIGLSHTVTGGGPSYTAPAQPFVVLGPEFAIDSGVVQAVYPPDGNTDVYGQILPFIVLTDATLPWERSLVPGKNAPDPSNPTPWLALVILREDEIYLDPDTKSPTETIRVAELLAPSDDVLKPTLPSDWVSTSTLAATCQAITIPGAVFESVMPWTTDLPYLAHTRQVDTEGEDPVLLAVVMANRLALAADGADTKYYAHLVSLEGFADYLGPNGKAIPDKTGEGQSGLKDVQLASLASFSFVSVSEKGQSFAALVQGLIDSQAESPALALPLSDDTSGLPPAVVDRVSDGYVALDWVTGAQEKSFAWYRGPLSAVVPQPLPEVGSPPVPASLAPSSDALMIYLADQGLFDLGYASAYQLGRALALSDGTFAQAMYNYRRQARSMLARATQRASLPHLAGAPAEELFRANPTRRRFAQMVSGGLGERWTSALATANDRASTATPRSRAPKLPGAAAMRAMLARADLQTALADSLAESMDPVAAWLAKLSLLEPVPFSHMVPDARLLPQESIRFFYVDGGWLDALTAGATSISVQSSADVAIQQVMRPRLAAAVAARRARLIGRRRGRFGAEEASTTTPMTGLLLRSQIVPGWPSLVVNATQGGNSLALARRATLAPDVLLCLFAGIPDQVSIAEPYQGLCFGVEDNGVALRNVTTPGQIGKQIPDAYVPASGGYDEFLAEYTRSQGGGVVTVASLAAALQGAVGATSFGAGDFAIQMVFAPELQLFPSGAHAARAS